MTQDTRNRWLEAALALPPGALAFPWQDRLLRELVSGRMPTTLDLPTGLGKTSVMAIWLVARALGAPVPRRLVYLVDRRAVVDQATAVAEELRQIVSRTPELRAALGLAGPLPISTLRGQHADNREWLVDPSAPAIVVGTVDMVGSRLLFSGYGVSRKMRPYHAGLLGADAWLVLDEAHLVPAFERLVRQISHGLDADARPLGALADAEVVPACRMLSLSATGRPQANSTPFVLDADDLGHPVVHQRLHASKRLRLFEAVDAKDLATTLAAHAWDLCAKGRKPGRIIVFTSIRDDAQKVQQALLKLAGKSPPAEVHLFVGGRRVHEREMAARQLATLGFVAGSGSPPDRPMFVVATSAGEVGVDLDADHAVCDLVAWERMVQRLGRVNRRGAGDASVIIVPARSEHTSSQARQAEVLALLRQLPLTRDGAHNGSPAALGGLKGSADALAAMARASTPAPLHPPLTRALVDAWAMTALDQHTGRPEVEPWLRGWPDEPELPQVSLLWRSRLPLDDEGRVFTGDTLALFLDAAGPHLSERLEADLPQVLDWLIKRARRLPAARSRADDAGAPAAPFLLAADHVAVLVDDATGRARALTGEAIATAQRRELETWLRGTTLWVHSQLGGLKEGLLDEDEDAPAVDVTEALLPDGLPVLPVRLRRVQREEALAPEPGWRREASLPLASNEDGVTAWLLVSSRLDTQAESEEGRSSAQRAQWLSEHLDWTEQAARAMAHQLKLPEPYAEMLAVAAQVHDEGKRAQRWQQAFHAPDGGRPPYAKTLGRPDVALLDGYRHEFGSLPFAEAHPRVKALPPNLRELCLHLVAAHHGAARPLIRTDGAAEPPSRATARAREVALRFCALGEQWGHWGLAWWESLLRAADQQASRRNDEEGARHG